MGILKVVAYYKSVPQKNSNVQKTALLENYIQGVRRHGDIGELHNDFTHVPSDVGLIQGWVYENTTPPHLRLRKNVIDQQRMANKYAACADANLFLYADKTNPHGYLRYSYNGVFPNTGIYCDTEIDPKRWQKISLDTNIQLKDYRKKGAHILLMMQRQGGWSMGNYDVVEWTLDTIRKIKKHTDRPILLRAHPGDRNAKHYLYKRGSRLHNIPNVVIGKEQSDLKQELGKAWAVVNHNSSAVVGPIIQGYHCFLTDPASSQCAEVSNTDFSTIEKPKEFDRQKWLERISMFHWSFEELRNGDCWAHMRNYAQ